MPVTGYSAGSGVESDFIAALYALINTCGWTIDRYDVGSRIHFHDSFAHFEVWKIDDYSLGVVACDSYDAGLTPANQPGATPQLGSYNRIDSDILWKFVCTGQAFYCFARQGYSNVDSRFISFGKMTESIGGWTNGHYVFASSGGHDGNDYWPLSGAYGHMIIDGDIVTTGAPNYGRLIAFSRTNIALQDKMPFIYNGGILPIPVTAFLSNASNSSLYHPVGFFHGIYKVSGKVDYYELDEEIVLDDGTYKFLEDEPGVTTSVEWLVKVDEPA